MVKLQSVKQFISTVKSKIVSLVSLYKFFGSTPNIRNPYVYAPPKDEVEKPDSDSCEL